MHQIQKLKLTSKSNAAKVIQKKHFHLEDGQFFKRKFTFNNSFPNKKM